jgi:catechol 2,3-dioxygenase-like lactoylglutathione lyase family enzyme
MQQGRGAKILLCGVDDPRAYGVAELDGERVIHIDEKPKNPKSNWAVIGVYFYDSEVFDIVRRLTPSARNELEITDVNNQYILRGEMTADKINGWWADGGENIDFYLKASNQVARSGANKPDHSLPAPPERPEPILGIHHAQITVPETSIPAAKQFYCGVLGLPQVERPHEFGDAPVFWVRVGNRNLHINVDEIIDRSLSRAHLAYEVADIRAWESYLTKHGIAVEHPTPFAGHARFQIRDPFGNMVEFIQRLGQ